MSDLQLEVGKAYLRAAARSRTSPVPSFDLVKILGRVEEGTIEYEKGFRFFGDDKVMYTEHGRIITGSGFTFSRGWNRELKKDARNKRVPNMSLEREAVGNDFLKGFSEKYWVSSEKANNPLRFVSCKDPSFLLVLGGMYIDRMGFEHFINEIDHQRSGDYLRYRSERCSFLETGKRWAQHVSMRDIVFQRI